MLNSLGDDWWLLLLLHWLLHLEESDLVLDQRLALTTAWILFQSTGISESVESMVSRGAAGGDAGDHDDADAICIHHK